MGRLSAPLGVVAAGLCIVAAEAAATSGWTIEPTPNPARTTHSQLEGVSCTAARTCTAVGFYKDPAGRYATLAERWNGKKWTIEPTPNPAGAKVSPLVAVSCTAAKSCTAVGFYTNGAGKQSTLAERWNGKKWTIERTPNPHKTTVVQLYGVSCVRTKACIAVGSYLTSAGRFVTLAERWNGKRWTIERTSSPAGARVFSSLNAVSCTAGNVCTAVGYYSNNAGKEMTLAERRSAKKWTIERTPNPAGAKLSLLDGVSCTAVSACIAVGSDQNSAGTRMTVAERWNGKGWTIEPTPNPSGAVGGYLYGVSCTTANACTAVGPYRDSAGKELTLAEHWNGMKWAIERTPNPRGAVYTCLYGASCTTGGACTAVGHYRNRAGRKFTLAEQGR